MCGHKFYDAHEDILSLIIFYPRLELLELLCLRLEKSLAKYGETSAGKCGPDPCEVLTDQSVLGPHHGVGLALSGQIPEVEQVVSSPDWAGAGSERGERGDSLDVPHPWHHSVLWGRTVQQTEDPPYVIAQPGLSLSSCTIIWSLWLL